MSSEAWNEYLEQGVRQENTESAERTVGEEKARVLEAARSLGYSGEKTADDIQGRVLPSRMSPDWNVANDKAFEAAFSKLVLTHEPAPSVEVMLDIAVSFILSMLISMKGQGFDFEEEARKANSPIKSLFHVIDSLRKRD